MRDVDAAVAAGADAVGVIFSATSPRSVSGQLGRELARAVPAFVSLVGVLVEPTVAQIDGVLAAGYLPQFSGNESAQSCESATARSYIKVFHIPPHCAVALDPAEFERSAQPFARATWMFDTVVDGKRGGTGRTFDWELVRAVAANRRIVISGGLTPDNVGACIGHLRPYGVDVRSGIETDGVKDPAKMRAFISAVRKADAQA